MYPNFRANTRTFAYDLTTRRIARGWTQQQLSNKTGISRATIGAYEEGRAEPPLDKFIKICEAFGITNLFKVHEAD